MLTFETARDAARWLRSDAGRTAVQEERDAADEQERRVHQEATWEPWRGCRLKRPALVLRAGGASYPAIGRELGISAGAARHRVESAVSVLGRESNRTHEPPDLLAFVDAVRAQWKVKYEAETVHRISRRTG